jgi:5-methylcytosine-specific restriction enzyme A
MFEFEFVDPQIIKKERAKARELRASLWWRQQVGPGICYHCGIKVSSIELTMDHVTPIARGGRSNKKNVVPSCKPCNNQKGHLTKGELALREKNF